MGQICPIFRLRIPVAFPGMGRVSRTYVFARSAPDAEYDRSLAWAALLLAAAGLVMVYSASISIAEGSRFTGNNSAWYLTRHAVFLAAALCAAGRIILAIHFWITNFNSFNVGCRIFYTPTWF